MISSSLDPFSLSFDSIPVRPEKAAPVAEHAFPDFPDAPTGMPAPLLFEHETLPEATAPLAPGYYLLDDAAGRFTIDRDSGVVTLVHDHLMALEAGAIHPVHIQVIEPNGSTYELRFRLRMTGRVPQIAGNDDNDTLASLAAAPLLDLMSPIERAVATVPVHTLAWSTYSGVVENHGVLQRLAGETVEFGALIDPPTAPGYFAEGGQLELGVTLPPPAKAHALWTTWSEAA